MATQIEGLVIQPRPIAKLECKAVAGLLRERAQELSQDAEIAFKTFWRMEQHRPEPAGTQYRLNRLQEFPRQLCHLAQAREMGDCLMSLYAELKVFRRSREPALDGLFVQALSNGVA